MHIHPERFAYENLSKESYRTILIKKLANGCRDSNTKILQYELKFGIFIDHNKEENFWNFKNIPLPSLNIFSAAPHTW